MNWLRRLVAGLRAFFESEIERVSKLDGKPGLSAKDVVLLLEKVKEVQDEGGPWTMRKEMLESWMLRAFKDEKGRLRFPEMTVEILGYLAYALARKKGII